VNRALEIGLTLVLLGTAVAFGGVEPLAYSLAEVGIFFLLLVFVLVRSGEGKVKLYLPLWALLFVLWVGLEMVPLPAGWIVVLSPLRAADLHLGKGLGVAGEWGTLSIDGHSTALALVKFLAYLSVFVLGASLFESQGRRSLLPRALVGVGCGEAVYGIYQFLTGSRQILNFAKLYDIGVATGTYINRNHYAGLLELTTPFALAGAFYSFQRWSEGRAGSLDRAGRPARESYFFQFLFYLFLTVLMIIAGLLSGSRMGVFGLLFSLLFIALLAQMKTQRKGWLVGVFLFSVCTAGYALWIGMNPLMTRFVEMRHAPTLEMQGRTAIWEDALAEFRASPLVGSGLGTFRLGYRGYQTSQVEWLVDHAHNDYLEMACETGVLGGALFFLPLLYLLGRMVGAFLADGRAYRRAIILGCVGSTLAMLLHSVTDFNLEIPANALTFALVLGIGYKAACLEPRQEKRLARPAGSAA
jgi:O-antigen ligase